MAGLIPAALGLFGSLFGSHHYGSPPAPGAFLAQGDQNASALSQQSLQDNLLMAQTVEQSSAISGESSRAVARASTLSTISSKQEGLMLSIQQAEMGHIKKSFDIVSQS